MKKLLLFSIMLSFMFGIKAQNGVQKQVTVLNHNQMINVPGSQEGYYVTNDHKIVRGIWILDLSEGEKAGIVIIPEQPNHEAKTFHPGDIIEYGFVNGERYISANLEMNQSPRSVFLEQILEDDSISIYLYGGIRKHEYYFMQKGHGAILPMKDGGKEYRNYLRSKAADCPALSYLDNNPMKLSRYEIVRIYRAYTECNVSLYQRTRWGVHGRVGLSHLNEGLDRSFNSGISCAVGMFAQINLDGCFSFCQELNFLYAFNEGHELYDKMKYESSDYTQFALEVPLLFRYTNYKSVKKWIPYGELGPSCMLSFNNGSKDNSGSTVDKNRSRRNRFLYGAAIGAGAECRLNGSHSLTIGARCSFAAGVKTVRKEQLLTYSLVVSANF